MPRNVRNFWIDLEVDGRKSRIKTGPRHRDGGFTMELWVRRDGQPDRLLELIGNVDNDGKLRVRVWSKDRHDEGAVYDSGQIDP